MTIRFQVKWKNRLLNLNLVILALKPTHVQDVQNQQQFQISQSKTEYRIEKYSNGSKRLVDISLDSVSNISIEVLC